MDPVVLQSLVRTIEIKDRCTAAHTWRVVLYARALAEDAGSSHAVIERLTGAAALHDIGKIDIPDEVLLKPGRLTDDEFLVMQKHTTLGHARLVGMGVTDELTLSLVRHHHERWDGEGYPDRLRGESIPLVAQMFAVVDSFDAMTGLRPYRMPLDDTRASYALEQLIAGRERQFAPDAVDRFVRLFEAGTIEWILHYFNDEMTVPEFNPLLPMVRRDALEVIVRPEVGVRAPGGVGGAAGGGAGSGAAR